MKILTILGARPQFIKASVMSRAFKNISQIQETIIHTHQHYDNDMNEIFFSQLDLPIPNHILEISQNRGLGFIGKILLELEKLITNIKPSAILVYGDTDSTLAGAMCGARMQIPVIHIESGLRSFDMKMPEELNRILTDRVSSLLFCPTQTSIDNLILEGYQNLDIKFYKSGDIMYDSMLFYSQKAIKPNCDIKDNFILSTFHRSNNTDNPKILKSILQALEYISQKCQVILPIHPRTRKKIKDYEIEVKNITIIPPVGYFEMLYLLKNSKSIITDSGGLQKEAYFFKKPCLLLRENTEWIELVDNNYSFLTSPDKENIIQTFDNIDKKFNHDFSNPFYGDGKAGEFIAQKILEEI